MYKVLAILSYLMIVSDKALGLYDVIESDRVSNLGQWSDWEKCPAGNFVIGFKLRIDVTGKFVNTLDDTALNEIQLICSNNSTIHGQGSISGYWTEENRCKNGKRVIGFELLQQKPQAGVDNTAANDLNLICEDGSTLSVKFAMNTLNDARPRWGKWSQRKFCSGRQIICGLRVQVEPPQGDGDDTALNNVDFKCCSRT